MKIYAIIATIGLALAPISYAGAVDGTARAIEKIMTRPGKGVKVIKPKPIPAEVPRGGDFQTPRGGDYSQGSGGSRRGGGTWWRDGGSNSDSGYGQQPSQPIQMPCPSCGGKGQVPGALWGTNTCDQCRGSGVIVVYP